MSSSYLTYIRLGTFVTTLLFSLIVLCISADLVSLTSARSFFGFSALALATGLFTLITVGPMFFVDMYRQGSILSYIVVEIGCLSVLGVLWLSSGSYAASSNNNLFGQIPAGSSCNFPDIATGIQVVDRVCHETQAIMGFSFLTWIILMGYTILLLVLSLRAQGRGHLVWKTSVSDGALLYTSEKALGSMGPTSPSTHHQTYPPAAQQTLSSSISYSYPQA